MGFCYRCFLPDLTGFTKPCCVRPNKTTKITSLYWGVNIFLLINKHQLDLTRIQHSLLRLPIFPMRVVMYKTEFRSIFLYIASRCNIFLKQIHGVKINCCKALCFLAYLFFRENQWIGKSTMPTTSLRVDKILGCYLLGSDFCLNTPFTFLCFLLEKVVVCLQATCG